MNNNGRANGEKEVSHNIDVKWLEDLRTDQGNLPEQPVTITEADVQEKVSRMKSWAGPELSHAYWLKKLNTLLECLMNKLITDGTHPRWTTEGQTTLIKKDPQKGAIPPNYLPITCLSTTWKILSGIVAATMSGHMAPYISGTQKH